MRFLHNLEISHHKILTNYFPYKKKNNNFNVDRPDRHHHNQVNIAHNGTNIIFSVIPAKSESNLEETSNKSKLRDSLQNFKVMKD